ncbi:type IX secretion system membrane protein PorP/SprF [bacterium]|nr:type IX secretion system membrane protein PorP/SprF [bacterium]
MTDMNGKIWVFCAVLLLLPLAAPANFIEMETGARAMGMGGAFVAVADDVTALHWNPAGLVSLDEIQLFGMRTSVYSVEGLAEDSAMAGYGNTHRGIAAGWMRTSAEELYNEDTILLGYGSSTPIDHLAVGASLKRFSIDAPGYDYYNDPSFNSGGDAGYAVDLGGLYRRDTWSVGATLRNLGEPELQLIEASGASDPIYMELRLGGTYTFREVMLMSVEWRAPREAPEFYDAKASLNLGTEIWFYNAFALRAGMNRDRITAGLGIKSKNLRLDVALLSERRIGSMYRLSAMLLW